MISPLEKNIDSAIEHISSHLGVSSKKYIDKLPCVIDDVGTETSYYDFENNLIMLCDDEISTIYEESGHFLHECVKSRFNLNYFSDRKYGALNYFFHMINREAFGYYCQMLSGKPSESDIFKPHKAILEMDYCLSRGDVSLVKRRHEPVFKQMVLMSESVLKFSDIISSYSKGDVSYADIFSCLKDYYNVEFCNHISHGIGYQLGRKLYKKEDEGLVLKFIKSPVHSGFRNYFDTVKKLENLKK